MIIDNIRLDTNAKKRAQNWLPDLICIFSCMFFAKYGNISILRNRMFNSKPFKLFAVKRTEVFFKLLPL